MKFACASLWTLGDGPATTTNSAVPTRIGTDSDWSSVAVVRDSGAGSPLAALKSDGSLWVWDVWNGSGMERNGLDYNWTALSAGGEQLVALKQDGSLWTWDVLRPRPTRIGSDSNWLTVAAGGRHIVGLKTDGSLWAWGDNTWGQCGFDTGGNFVAQPTRVGSDNDWKAIAASGDADLNSSHTVALKADGSLWARQLAMRMDWPDAIHSPN